MGIIVLDDNTARIEVTVFSSLLAEVEQKLTQDQVIFIRGTVEMEEYSGSQNLRMRADSIMNLAEIRAIGGQILRLSVNALQWNKIIEGQLKSLLQESEEGCTVIIDYQTSGARCDLRLGKQWRIKPDDNNVQQLKRCLGEESVNFI